MCTIRRKPPDIHRLSGDNFISITISYYSSKERSDKSPFTDI